jgi:hypothetical protein
VCNKEETELNNSHPRIFSFFTWCPIERVQSLSSHPNFPGLGLGGICGLLWFTIGFKCLEVISRCSLRQRLGSDTQQDSLDLVLLQCEVSRSLHLTELSPLPEHLHIFKFLKMSLRSYASWPSMSCTL